MFYEGDSQEFTAVFIRYQRSPQGEKTDVYGMCTDVYPQPVGRPYAWERPSFSHNGEVERVSRCYLCVTLREQTGVSFEETVVFTNDY